jgi:hypothetical protein
MSIDVVRKSAPSNMLICRLQRHGVEYHNQSFAVHVVATVFLMVTKHGFTHNGQRFEEIELEDEANGSKDNGTVQE